MIICLGPVCIPLWGLLPFLVGLLHSYGYLKWFKKEWVTYRYWKQRVWGPKPVPAGSAAAGASGSGGAGGAGGAGGSKGGVDAGGASAAAAGGGGGKRQSTAATDGAPAAVSAGGEPAAEGSKKDR
ncbi:hypothetical protein HYH03_016072 [Edaphochlamys debaryana]|uniref:Uncharacterized protein n=1 Tax=Edaphochlamys debaryana TaxID=47281 RepID=A0A835XLV5_9CHLO|nr:hypothetical protein HYH03_016072 [Edaphochlamys debaryana]|eukprot:KAG2485183.1 hypothetical protein HYH03_016072 [Edaphochlamys debaryana]